MNNSGGRPRITLTDPVIVDLSRIWRAEREGRPRAAPPADPHEARLLVRSYQTEAAHLDETGAHDRALFFQRRADEIRRAL
ncbi:hypothetical protein [Streptomyces ipomoeae]|uniref:hypothetical protein n=1 Tax=Streptomyces ipomoeae TaxID=103232 RepID=UPI001147A4CE|nr:hypothetical protein [Streptomyces ipomoeae]TQE33114.1 hypothetical protein Sipo7851_21695 [Streptomyces ipomoeae]